MPNYGAGLRLSDLPRKPKAVDTRAGVQLATCVLRQLPVVAVSRPSKGRPNTERRYVTALAAAGLSFDDAVVRDRCFQADPFDRRFKTSLMNRTRRRSVRNDISYLSRPVDPLSYLKPVKPARSGCDKSETVPAVVAGAVPTNGTPQPKDAPPADSDDDTSLRQIKSTASDNYYIPSDEQKTATDEWDECLVLKLSANTARWIAQNPATSEDARDRLGRILDAVHGPANIDDRVELVEEETHSETDATAAANVVKKPWLSDKDL